MATAKVVAIGLMVVGAIYLALLLLVKLFDARSILDVYGFYGGGSLLGDDLLSAILAIVGLLLTLWITGFIVGALYAWTYNLTLKWTGGLHVDVDVPALTGDVSIQNTGTKRTIRRVGVMSYARYGVLVGLVLGVEFIVVLLLIVLFDMRPLLSIYAMYGGGNLLGNGLLSSITAIVGWILLFIITGFITGLLIAWFFNIGTRWIGGLPINVAPGSSNPPVQSANAASTMTSSGGSGTVRRTIGHADVMSFTKVSALGYMLFTLASDLIILLIVAFNMRSLLPNFGLYDGGDLLGNDWLSAIASIVGSAITYAIVGGVTGALVAWLFNATVKWTHGVQFDVS
jgi:hypothetical protein